MRRTMLSMAAALALLSAGAFLPNRAEALTLAAPAGMQEATGGSGLVQDAAYICRRAWRCGYYGCGWRRACWWTRPYSGGYGYRPYWRRGYYHRHYWHHHW